MAGKIVSIAHGGDPVLLLRQLGGGVVQLVRVTLADSHEIVIEQASNVGDGRFLYSADEVVVGYHDINPAVARIRPDGVALTRIAPDRLFDLRTR